MKGNGKDIWIQTFLSPSLVNFKFITFNNFHRYLSTSVLACCAILAQLHISYLVISPLNHIFLPILSRYHYITSPLTAFSFLSFSYM